MTTNRFSTIVALFVIAALGLFTISMLSMSRPATANSARSYLQQRLGEWTAGVTAQQAYLEQRHGEQTTGHAVNAQRAHEQFRQADEAAANADAQQAYRAYRHGEQTAGVNPVLAYLEYRRGEWSGK